MIGVTGLKIEYVDRKRGRTLIVEHNNGTTTVPENSDFSTRKRAKGEELNEKEQEEGLEQEQEEGLEQEQEEKR